jgi:heme/copper-type cytochrome/quinol oxidase subunit 2
MNIVTIWPLVPIIIVLFATFFTFKAGGFLDQYRDWRHGQAVDETLDWQAFTDAFKESK